MPFGLSRFDLTTLTRRLELPEISVDPTKPLTLILRFMGIGNRDWEAWRFARDAAEKPTTVPGSAAPPEKTPGQRFIENRADARDCLLATSLMGWENVIENDAPAAFTPEAAARFLAEIHDSVPLVLAQIADFASTRSNFRTVPAADPVDLGKG